jgi:hypothetical protein
MPEQRSGWSREFDEPIAVPDSGKLVTLRDAADYITALPDEEAALPDWQAAIEALMLVADLGGPTMFARIGVMRALNRRAAQGDPADQVKEKPALLSATAGLRLPLSCAPGLR